MEKPTHAHAQSFSLSAGKRMTKARKEIMSLLATGIPLTTQMIVSKVSANETSVYRTIQLLKTEHAVEEIAFPDGTMRYTLSDHHHHHIICVTCGYTEHLPCSSSPIPVKSKHFKEVSRHEVTYYGRCATCV